MKLKSDWFDKSLNLELIKTLQIIARNFPCFPIKVRKIIEDHIISFFQHDHHRFIKPNTIGAVLCDFYQDKYPVPMLFRRLAWNPCKTGLNSICSIFNANYEWIRGKRREYLQKLGLIQLYGGYPQRYNSVADNSIASKNAIHAFADNSTAGNEFSRLFSKKPRKKRRK